MGLNFFSVDEIGPNILIYVQNFIQKVVGSGLVEGVSYNDISKPARVHHTFVIV